MATTKTTSKRSKGRNGSRAKPSSAGKGSASKRSARSSSANSRSKTRSTSRSQKKGNVEAIKDTAVDTAVEQTKSAGATIADAAGKAKTPLIAGGTALLGLAAGAAISGRLSAKSKNPIKRMRGASLPKLDLDKVKLAADRVSAYGQQASDIAAAAEKTRKKNG